MAPLAAYTRRSLAAGGALALLASVIALFLAAALTRPIGALVSAARRVSKGTLDVQVDVAPDDEYRELGEAFNEMIRSLRDSREDLDRQVEENERLLQSLLPASAAAQVRGARPRRLSRSPTSPSRTSISSAWTRSRASWARIA